MAVTEPNGGHLPGAPLISGLPIQHIEFALLTEPYGSLISSIFIILVKSYVNSIYYGDSVDNDYVFSVLLLTYIICYLLVPLSILFPPDIASYRSPCHMAVPPVLD